MGPKQKPPTKTRAKPKEEKTEEEGKTEEQEDKVTTEEEPVVAEKPKTKKKPKIPPPPPQPVDNNHNYILVAGFVALVVVLLYLFSASSPSQSSNRTRAKPLFLNPWPFTEQTEVKHLLESFFNDLVAPSNLALHAKVLQVESTSYVDMQAVRSVASGFVSNHTTQFHWIEIDATPRQDAKLPMDFFTTVHPELAIVVAVYNADKATSKFLLSLCGIMENPTLAYDMHQRDARTVGFLFLGSSLGSGKCHTVDLLEHDDSVLHWPKSFISRLSDQVKLCEDV